MAFAFYYANGIPLHAVSNPHLFINLFMNMCFRAESLDDVNITLLGVQMLYAH